MGRRLSLSRTATKASTALLDLASDDRLDLTGEERDAIALVRFMCHEIEEGGRRRGEGVDEWTP